MFLIGAIAVAAYVGSIVLSNFLFSYVPMINTPMGLLSPVALIVGFTFVLRDFAQRAVGHWILAAMAAGAGISFAMASPTVAMASAVSFACSEMADYALYTYTKRPFHQRIMLSSLVSTPIDTAMFLWLIGGFTVGTVVLMFLSKMIAAMVVWYIYRSRHDEMEFA